MELGGRSQRGEGEIFFLVLLGLLALAVWGGVSLYRQWAGSHFELGDCVEWVDQKGQLAENKTNRSAMRVLGRANSVQYIVDWNYPGTSDAATRFKATVSEEAGAFHLLKVLCQ